MFTTELDFLKYFLNYFHQKKLQRYANIDLVYQTR